MQVADKRAPKQRSLLLALSGDVVRAEHDAIRRAVEAACSARQTSALARTRPRERTLPDSHAAARPGPPVML